MKQLFAAPYVYRNESCGAAIKVTAIPDGKVPGDTASRKHLHAETEPGKHRLALKTENESILDFNAMAGKTCYDLQEAKTEQWQARGQLQMVDEKTGQAGVIESQLSVQPL